MPCPLHFPSNILPSLVFPPEDLRTTEAWWGGNSNQIRPSRLQLDKCSHSSLMATFRLAFNRGALTPGNEISSAIHFGLPYHFLKLCPTASTGSTTPRDRWPRARLPRLPPRAWWSLALLSHEVGPPARDPPWAAATGARRDSRAAPGPVASGDAAWARGALT